MPVLAGNGQIMKREMGSKLNGHAAELNEGGYLVAIWYDKKA